MQTHLSPRQAARELGISLDRVYVLLWAGPARCRQKRPRGMADPGRGRRAPQGFRCPSAMGTASARGCFSVRAKCKRGLEFVVSW
jgi:hypothetical protein